jgi:hypothetical protein
VWKAACLFSLDGTFDEVTTERGNTVFFKAKVKTNSFVQTQGVWKVDGLGNIITLRGHQGEVFVACDLIVTGSDDLKINFWNRDACSRHCREDKVAR